MEDGAIVELYWQRDEQAITETDKAHGGKLYGLSLRIVGIREDAEESVSDTYLKAWETIPPQRPTYFFAYLAKICRNFALGRLNWKNAAKRKAEVVCLTQEMEACIPDARREAELEGKELARLLDAFLRTLSRENRMIFLRRYWYADPVAGIAARYGLTESAVTMRLSRTREKLRDYLEKEGITV